MPPSISILGTFCDGIYDHVLQQSFWFALDLRQTNQHMHL